MIRDYYGARRWDEDGRVPEARLRELGLSCDATGQDDANV